MQDYGIDGVFVQRFANGLKNPPSLEHCNTVLANCREGANQHGRAYAVMYDLSGLPAGHIDDVINDWRALRSQMVITEDPAYLNHRGKPVVAVWGIGFNDGRDYTLAECRRLIEFLKNDPPSDQTPRLRGQFLWSQFCGVKRANAAMVYVAMFDEVDEGTAIFKCANKVPVTQISKFVTYEGLPGDFYLKLVGKGTRLI